MIWQHEQAAGGLDMRETLFNRRAIGVAAGEYSRVARIVVDSQQICARVLPTVVANHRSAAVEHAGQVIRRMDKVRLVRRHGQVWYAQRFVESHPGHDAWVSGVTGDRLGPLTGKPPGSLRAEAVSAWHLLPNEKAEHVGPVEVARVLDLLLLARRMGRCSE